MFKSLALVFLALLVSALEMFAQTRTNSEILLRLAKDRTIQHHQNFQRTLVLAKEKNWPLTVRTPGKNFAFLVGVDPLGYPIYVGSENNSEAAFTIGTNQLYNGGSLGINLHGSSNNVRGKMAVWDGSRVRGTHVELTGRVIQRDNPAAGNIDEENHATHVAGTMVASGVNANARGMAWGFRDLYAYDFLGDDGEIAFEAPNLLLSNHSYGTLAGWRFNNRWEFLGRWNENEDWKFGFYDDQAQLFDSILWNAPFYLMVKSAGNFRSQNGPAVGQTYWRMNQAGQWVSAARPAGISSNDGFETISTWAGAKNILTVGAITGIPQGYSSVNDAVMSNFSCWGPTDDGRIKPDIVADGVNVLSPVAGSDNSYASLTGTSMSSPSVTGSLLLLQEYYAQQNNGQFLRSSTLKGLILHTANEAGNPGPDYQFGWGVANISGAAQIIKEKNTGSNIIQEALLNSGSTYTFNVIASGSGPLVATICWTDPKGSVDASLSLNNPTRKLVHDLDLRIVLGSVLHQPWVLNPAAPSANAVRGDNDRDNVEQVVVQNPVPGAVYTIRVTHKNMLQRGQQAFGLIISGAGGTPYCMSAASNNAGTRIDSVQFAGIQNATPAGCTTYNNFTTSGAGTIQPGQTLPFRIRVGSCDASMADKMIKVFIDYNNNANFADAGELVATSGVISGTGVFSGTILTPTNLRSGSSVIMRIVAQETTNATSINPCGNYLNGETQDYQLIVATPTTDLSIVGITAPANGDCASPIQLATVRIRNSGASTQSNFPVVLSIRDGATPIFSINANVPVTIAPGETVPYTFQTSFATISGRSYSVTAYTNANAEQIRSNDTLRTNVSIAASPAAPSGVAEICNSNAVLRVNSPVASTPYYWYRNATTDSAIVVGTNVNTTVIPPANTYHLGIGAQGNVGLITKEQFPNSGSYTNALAYFNYTATQPVILENARVYSRWQGPVRITVADISQGTGGSFTYTTVYSTTEVIIPATSLNPASGQQPNDPNDPGAIINLNIPLPQGSHSIVIEPVGQTNLYRNNNIQATGLYPFSLPNVISITNQSLTITNPSVPVDRVYYFLYNMRVRTLSCTSSRVPIVANVVSIPTITQSGDSLVSSAATGNQWYFNNNLIPGATGRSFKPTQTGSYFVFVTGTLGCQLASNPVNVTLTNLINLPPAEIGLKVSPNPNQGQFMMQFRVSNRADLSLELINTSGQVVYNKQVPKFVGTYTENFQRKSLASGVYVLRVQHGDKAYNQKIIIQ